jgi:hypothetical protein
VGILDINVASGLGICRACLFSWPRPPPPLSSRTKTELCGDDDDCHIDCDKHVGYEAIITKKVKRRIRWPSIPQPLVPARTGEALEEEEGKS